MSVKLLIADDEDFIRRGVAKYIKLHTDRFDKVYEAENGQEAIDIIIKYKPDIALLDVQMPLKTGIEVMQEAEKSGICPITVILSGYDEFKYAQQALKLGAKDYLLKPVRGSDILNRLNELADEYLGLAAKVEKKEEESSNPIVALACEFIAEHFTEPLSLADVAEKTGVSSGYLSSLFTQNLQCGFVDYLNKIRVERACCYLEQNYLKTYEIAYKVGFRDEKYFSKVFKKVTGMSPKEYKAQKSMK